MGSFFRAVGVLGRVSYLKPVTHGETNRVRAQTRESTGELEHGEIESETQEDERKAVWQRRREGLRAELDQCRSP